MRVKFVNSVMAGIAIFLLATVAFAAAPTTISYQGSLTDGAGAPVADGQYLLQFRIYDSEAGGTTLWNSSFRQIDVVGGLFSYNLGDTVALSPSIFQNNADLWLGVKVGTDSELIPRTKFTSVGHAFHAETAVSALSVEGDPFVRKSGDDMTGALRSPGLNLGTANTTTGYLNGYSQYGPFRTLDIGEFANSHYIGLINATTGHWSASMEADPNGGGGGVLILRRNSAGDVGFYLDGNFGGSEEPAFGITGSSRDVQFNMGIAGDESVKLPDDAISSTEILNEPGIATVKRTNWVPLTQGTGVMEDVCIVTITIPTSGYIHLSGNINGITYGTTGRNYGRSQIDETSGGSYYSSHGMYWGGDSRAGTNYHNVLHTRTYFKSAGTYSFRLEAEAYLTNAAGAETKTRGWLLATYYPTSYGSVITTTSDPNEFTDAKAISIEDIDGTVTTAYEVDLRELELRAARLRAETAEAELELISAQQAQAEQSMNEKR